MLQMVNWGLERLSDFPKLFIGQTEIPTLVSLALKPQLFVTKQWNSVLGGACVCVCIQGSPSSINHKTITERSGDGEDLALTYKFKKIRN